MLMGVEMVVKLFSISYSIIYRNITLHNYEIDS